MKNIVFIMPNLGGGGAEKVIINILNNIDYKEFKVTLLLHCKDGIYIDQINKNVKLKYIYDPNKFIYNNIFKYAHGIYYRIIMFLYNNFPKLLYRVLIGNKNKTEIAFLEGEPIRFLNNSSNNTSKKIAWIHTDIKSFDEERINKERYYYKRIDSIVCVSNDALNSFKEVYPEYGNKVEVIYNLIDSSEIVKKAKEYIDYKFNKNTIIAVGRLIDEKRFDVLIKAHKLLLDDGVENNLIILGEGFKRDNLNILIKNLNVESTVKLLGFKRNPYSYIDRSDIFVLSSDIEGFPLVVCEALCLGKAIVSTNCTGPVELLDNGEFGLVCNKNNELELKENLKKLLLNTEIKEFYENKSLERSKIFNIKNSMNTIYSIINN